LQRHLLLFAVALLCPATQRPPTPPPPHPTALLCPGSPLARRRRNLHLRSAHAVGGTRRGTAARIAGHPSSLCPEADAASSTPRPSSDPPLTKPASHANPSSFCTEAATASSTPRPSSALPLPAMLACQPSPAISTCDPWPPSESPGSSIPCHGESGLLEHRAVLGFLHLILGLVTSEGMLQLPRSAC
ncbi:hypothetical protein BRADI_3g13887v3, partial [Brachypodium distachyon]